MLKTLMTGSKLAVVAFAVAVSFAPAAATARPQNDLVRVYYDAAGGTVGVYVRNCLMQSSMMGETSAVFEDFLTSCEPDTLDDPCNNWPGGSLGACPF